MAPTKPKSRLSRVALLCGAVLLVAPGCYARARAEPAVFVEADYTPVEVHTYPRAQYEGRVVYYVHDHWYTRDNGRWVYYRVEPEPLRRERVYIQAAPRAPERRHRHYDRDRRDRRDHRHHDERRYHSAPPANRR